MRQQHVHLPVVPCRGIRRRLQPPHAPALQYRLQPRQLVPVAVEQQARLVQRLHQLAQGFQLRVVYAVDAAVLVVHAAAAQLQQLPGQRGGGRGANLLVVADAHHHRALHLPVCPLPGLVQRHRHVVDHQLRQLQPVLGLHAHADVADLRPHRLKRAGLRRVLVSPRVVVEIPLTVVRDVASQPLPAVQQINLAPQVHDAVGRGRAGQDHHAVNLRQHPPQGLEALRRRVLEARRFVHHDHVKRPGRAVFLHQPRHVLPVDDRDVGPHAYRVLPVSRGPQRRRNRQPVQMVPLSGLGLPGRLRHLLRRDHQYMLHAQVVVYQRVDGRQRDDALTQSAVQKQPDVCLFEDPLRRVLLIRMRFINHTLSLPVGPRTTTAPRPLLRGCPRC